MSYVIINLGTGKAHSTGYGFKVYPTERGAKGACTRLNKEYQATQWEIQTLAEYNSRPVKMITCRNLMTGIEFQIPEDTPHCCNPAFESYYSM